MNPRRYAILADLHGNLPALEAVLADIANQGCDEIILAGDLTSGCPFPRETLARLRELPACRCIRGNNETYLLKIHQRTCHPSVLTSRQWGATRWAYEQLGPADLDWIEALPGQLVLKGEGGDVRVVHGSPARETEGLVPDQRPDILETLRRIHVIPPGETPPPLSQAFASIEETVLVCGHYHIPWIQSEGDHSLRLAFNPGSVGAPVYGDPRAQYALLEWREGGWQVEFRAIDYDLERCLKAFESSGLLAAGGAYARAYRMDVEKSTNSLCYFLDFALELARLRGMAGLPSIPDDIWLEAENTFDWEQAH